MENSSVDLNVLDDDIPLGFSVSVVGENFGDISSSSPMKLFAGCSFMINHMNGIRIRESIERNLPSKSTCKTDEIADEDDDLVNKENEPQTRNSDKKKNSSSKKTCGTPMNVMKQKSRNSKSTKICQKTDGSSMTDGAEDASQHGSADKKTSRSIPKLNKPTVGKTPMATGDAPSAVLRFLSKKDFVIDEIEASATPAKSDRKRLVKTPSPEIPQYCPVDEICEIADSELNLPRTRKGGEVGSDKSSPTSSTCDIVKEIYQWAIAFVKGHICVEGYVRGRNNESTLLRTSSVTDVLDSGRLIVTSGGSRYRLQGKILVNAALEAGVSINIANKFINGFPPGWKTYCRRGANLIGSENGSYQGDISSNQGDFSHPIFSDEKRGSKTIPMPVSEDSLSMSIPTESSSCNNDNYKNPAAMPDKMKLASTCVGPKTAKYASALTPVPELSKVPEYGASASSCRPSMTATTLQSRPEQRKCRSFYEPPPRIPGGTPAVRRTRSGREVKPVTFRAELLQSLERSLPKRSPPNGRNSVSTTKKKKLTPAAVLTPIAAPALGKKTKNAKKNEKKKRERKKSAKMLYTPDTKLGCASESEGTMQSKESAKITTPAGGENRMGDSISNRKKSEASKGKKNVKSPTKTAKTTPQVETVPTPQGAMLSGEKDKISTPAGDEKPPSKTKQELKAPKKIPMKDVAEMPMTRLRRRSYHVPITPLEIKETAAKFKTATAGSSKSKKATKPDKQKTRGTKRSREGGDIARPRKRTKKSEDQVIESPSPTPPSGGTKENDEVFIAADSDALNVENMHKRPATKKKKVETRTTKVAKTEKKWTKWQKSKLKKFVHSVNDIDWNKISEQMGFPANECEQVYTDMFRRKRKVAPKEKTDTGPVEITARVGTMKHRQQVRQKLEAMKKPKFQDLFAGEGPGIGSPVDNLFSADMFSAPGASDNFVPVTPNSRPPLSFDAVMETPAWFKTPTSSGNAFGFDGCTPVLDAQTPAALKEIFSPQRTKDADEKEKESKDADRIIVQMRKQMMRGTMRELTQKKETAQKNGKPSKSQKKKNSIDFGVIADWNPEPADDEEDSDKDEYFDFDQ